MKDWTILQGNVFDLLPAIAPGSVDVVVTSPPYWRLQSYLPKDHPLKAQELGSEATPEEFVANLVRVFALVRTALADHGVVFCDIGDSYASTGVCGGGSPLDNRTDGKSNKRNPTRESARDCQQSGTFQPGIPSGNLCLIPQRLAIALQEDGWCVRSVIVWRKPAPMPASLRGWSWQQCRVKAEAGPARGTGRRKVGTQTHGGKRRDVATFKDERTDAGKALSAEGRPLWSDCPGCDKCTPHGGYVLRKGSWRPTSSWEPILMLTKGGRYFADGDAVKTAVVRERDASNGGSLSREAGHKLHGEESQKSDLAYPKCDGGANLRDVWQPSLDDLTRDELIELVRSLQGNDLEDVWSIAAEPLNERHYAAFPTALVSQCLKMATSQRGYCVRCGLPWCRVVETTAYEPEVVAEGVRNVDASRGDRTRKLNGKDFNEQASSRTLGWRPSCKCNCTETRPALVLDPFLGSGRTLVAARRLGLRGVGCELNPSYAALAEREIAAALDEGPRGAEVPTPLFDQIGEE